MTSTERAPHEQAHRQRAPLDTARWVALVARLSLVEYRSVYTTTVLAVTVVPRVVLQVLFFALLGGYIAGSDGLTFAFVGATAHVVTLAGVVKAPDVLIDEKAYGTLHRLRLSRLPLLGILLTRQWVYAVEALAAVVVSTVAGGILLGRWALAVDMLTLLPLYALLVVSASGLGLAVAVVSVGRRADTLLPNAMGLLLLLASGVVVPVAALGSLSVVSTLLPLTHGLEAIRRVLDGSGPGLLPLLELAVGAGWYLVAAAGLRVQSWRSRRSGHDDYF